MQPDDAPEFFGRLTALAELFDAQFSPAKSALYFDALADLSLEQAASAMNAAARSCKFMPRPAELRTMVLGDVNERVERAWLAWRTAARKVGQYRSLLLEDTVLAETLEAVFGSWPAACSAEYSAEMWASKRKEFDRVYRALSGRDGASEPKLLRGAHAIANDTRGLTSPEGVPRLTAAGEVKPAVKQLAEVASAD